MTATVVVRVPDVADALAELQPHYNDVAKHTSCSVEVVLDLSRGDYAQETIAGEVYLSQNNVGICIEGKIAEVSSEEE